MASELSQPSGVVDSTRYRLANLTTPFSRTKSKGLHAFLSFLQDILASDLHVPLKRAKTVLSLLPGSVNHKTSP